MRTPSEIAEAFTPADRLTQDRPFYLVGIGGAGMSALAFMLHKRGWKVAGSDSIESPTTASLREAGIPVRIGHSGDDVQPGEQVVLSDAIDLKTSPEVAAARKLGCNLFRRSQLLNWLLKGKKIIAITGTHGKTTVTGMIGAGLRAAGMDPTIVVGAYVPEFGGSVVEGNGEYAVVEACEAYNAFLDLEPFIVVLTNLEPDHLDFHGNFEKLKQNVLEFANLSETLIYFAGDEECHALQEETVAGTWGYNAEDWEGIGARIGVNAKAPRLPGLHNKQNAAAAMTVVECLLESGTNLNAERAMCAVAEFGGAERRLQVLQVEPVTVIDDYAHHPTEVRASLSAIRERNPEQTILVVFQPHLYSRTAQYIDEFGEALSLADLVVLTDIYPARESPIPGVSSSRIAEKVTKPVWYVPSRHLLPQVVAQMAKPGDVVVGMGAGNISEFAPAFIRELERQSLSVSPVPSVVNSGSVTPQDRNTATPRRLKIAVVYGGDSAEREVSIHSGRAIHAALEKNGHDAFLLDVTDLLLGKGDVKSLIGPDRPDLAFLAVHGTNAEDGAIQGFFELLHIPYTGSGIQASALAMDKRLTKEILERRGLPVPKGKLIPVPDLYTHRSGGKENASTTDSKGTPDPSHLTSHISQHAPEYAHSLYTHGFGSDEKDGLQLPLIVKPNAQGSTVGLSYVHTWDELDPAIEKALHYDRAALVEEWVQGMEISVPVLGGKALPPVEICPASGQYDFASKYIPGATEEICPARLPKEVLERAQRYAEEAHAALGCEGATRTDMIVRNDVHPVILEVNTLPGMTGTSLLPNSAKAAGISFEELVEWIAKDALQRYASKA